MSELIPYQEIKLENQSVDEIWEDVEVLTNLMNFSRYERARRLIYLKETCNHGEYLARLKELNISSQEASEDTRFYTRYSNKFPQWGNLKLKRSKVRTLLELSNEDEIYLDEIPNVDKITSKQLREEIEKLKQEKEQERLANEALINSNQQLQEQLEKEKNTKKVEYRTNEIIVDPPDYEFIKDRIKELEGKEKSSEYLIDSLTKELDTIRNSVEEKDEQLKQYSELNSKLNSLGIGMDIRDQYLEDTTELAALVGSMNYFFDEKLAPTKYKRCLKYYRCDNAVIKSLRDIIEKTEDWLTEIKMYLPESNQDNYIEVINVEVK